MNTLIYILTFILGLCTGSFLNVVIYRLPRGESVVWPASHCPDCKTRLGPRDLLPLLSYIYQGGKCRYCTRPISIRYPLVEIAGGLLFLACYHRFGFSPTTFALWLFLALLLAITLIDLQHQRIPNLLVSVGLILGLALRLGKTIFPAATFLYPAGGWLDGLWGFLVGGGLMLVIFYFSRGGMGGGDVKLAALLGLWLGLSGTIVALLLGFVSGALVGLTLVLLGLRKRRDALPFAPFLNLGVLITLFWGQALIRWYFNLIGYTAL